MRVGHADEGVEFSIENSVIYNHSEGPVWNDELIGCIRRATHEYLIIDEVASDLTTAEADFDPMLLVRRGLFETR